MREFTKAMSRFSLAMSLFGVRQMTNLLGGRAGRAFDAVTDCTEAQLGGLLGRMYRAGDQWQEAMVDMMFGMFGLGGRPQGATAAGWGMRGAPRRGCGCGSGQWADPRGPAPDDPPGDRPAAGWGPMPAADPG